MVEFNNTQIDQKIEFWNEDEEYDEDNPGNAEFLMLVYSQEILNQNKPIVFGNSGGSSSPVFPSSAPSLPNSSNQASAPERLLTVLEAETSSSVQMYFSKYEMDENFQPMKGLPWWLLLILAIGILLLILLLVFIIYCCCCRKSKNETEQKSEIYKKKPLKSSIKKKSVPKNDTPPDLKQDVPKSNMSDAQSYYQDNFMPPIIQKEGDSKVNNYMPESSKLNNAL